MAVTLTVNPKALGKQIVSSAAHKNNATQILNSLYVGNKPLKKKFEELKQQMIREFNMHPVTREILGGPGAPNTSGTLKGYGNLFTFIGFEKGSQPIAPIVKLLSQTHLNVSRLTTRGTISVDITLPSREDIFAVTPMPWATGLSWAKRIEIGIAGYGEYINTASAKSRSSQGIQTKNDIRAGGFSNEPYISSFIKKWQNTFSDMLK